MSGGRKALAKQWRDFVGLRIAAEHRFREDELAVQVNVEDAVSPGDHLDDTDYVFPLLEDARHQTGGVGKRPSGDAVLDADVVKAHRWRILSGRATRGAAHRSGPLAIPHEARLIPIAS